MLGIGFTFWDIVYPGIDRTIASFLIPCWLRGLVYPFLFPKATETNKNHRPCPKSFMYFAMIDIEIIPSAVPIKHPQGCWMATSRC